MNKQELRERLRYFLKQSLDHFPMLYMAYISRKYRNHWFKQRIVKNSTDIVIEGFPRSANSFAVQAFKVAQSSDEITIATHVHSPSHVIKAVKLNKPVLVLIRNPRDTLISLRALGMQLQDTQAEAMLNYSFNHMASYYIHFYKRLMAFQDQVIFAEFDQVIKDFPGIINHLNYRYGTSFLCYGKDSIDNNKIFEKGGFHLSPNKKRNNFKELLDKSFSNNCSKDLEMKMNKIYNEVVELINNYELPNNSNDIK